MEPRCLFNTSAAIEAFTGFGLLVVPSMVIDLLFGVSPDEAGIAVARVLGVSLLSLGVSCWESSSTVINPAPRIGLCIYNASVAVLLLLMVAAGNPEGPLLKPALGLHLLFGVGMLWILLMSRRNSTDL